VLYSLPTKRTFDWALATFVVETICNPDVRHKLVANACARLRHNGALVLSARGPRDLVTLSGTAQRLADGYLMPGRTFVRAYTASQMRTFLTRCGFRSMRFLHKTGVNKPDLLHVIAAP
jgi:hypothetical protein